MDSKKIKFFAILMIIILVLSGIFFLSGIVINSSKATKEIQTSFNLITDQISSFADDYGILTEGFLQNSESILSQEKYLNAITIQKDDVVFYAYPLSSNLLKADDNGNAFISSSSPLNKVFTKSVILMNGDNLNFTVAYNTILQNELYKLCRFTFIIIFVCLILTIIAIPYFKYKENQKANSISPKNEFSNEEKEESFLEIKKETEEIQIEANSFIEEKNLEIKESNIEPEEIKNKNELQNDKNDFITSDSEVINNPKFTEKNDPMGLFSSITGFGWENYFEPRLDAELVRAASSEQDVSLFIIKLPELNKKSQAAEEIYQVILDFFKYRDMIFEYENDSFAGININMNLENAINFSEQLFINLYEIYESYKINSKIGIGITTRSMRLVPGNRLINEAKQAAEKALEEETMPIVAFKVNHEKYRDYITEEV